MYIPNWGEEVITGNSQIDGEHRELFSRIDALMTSMGQGRELGVIQETLNYFVLYARDHFKEEERLHRECQAPNYEEHLAAHRKIAHDIEVITTLYWEDGLSTHMEFVLINNVVRGIIDQLHEFDLPLAKFIQEKGHEIHK